MGVSVRLMAQRYRRLAGLLGMTAMVAGCAKPEEALGLVANQRMQVVLAAASAKQISMFGDLPHSGAPAYFTRAAMSLKQHTFTEVGGDFDQDIEAGGQRLVFASTRHNIRPDLYIKAIDGIAVTQLTADPASDIQPALSPDGTRVAFTSDRSGNWDIWIMDVDGGGKVRLTDGHTGNYSPVFSPDGRIFFTSNRSGHENVWSLLSQSLTTGSLREANQTTEITNVESHSRGAAQTASAKDDL